jgi:hypothetical protein
VNADGSKTYSPVFRWSDVGKNSSLQAEFPSTLLGYIICGWKGASAPLPMCLVSLTNLADNQVVTDTDNTGVTAAILNQSLAELPGMSSSLRNPLVQPTETSASRVLRICAV